MVLLAHMMLPHVCMDTALFMTQQNYVTNPSELKSLFLRNGMDAFMNPRVCASMVKESICVHMPHGHGFLLLEVTSFLHSIVTAWVQL